MIKLIGQPILVEYNADGTEGSVVSLPSDYQNRVRELQIISATEYHKEKERLETYQEQYSTSIASGATLMTRQQFEQGTYPTADGKVNIAPPKLPAYAKSVLVRGRTNRILNEPSELVLLNFSVDLTQHSIVPESGSVVLNPDGQIIASSPLNIAPRVGFFGDPNQKQISNSIFRKRDDQIFGPVVGVPVQVNEVFPGGMDVTNSEGKYTFALLLPPCPGFDFEWSIDVYANLNYTGFNPNGSATQPYYMRRQSWSMCMGIHELMLPYGVASYNEIEANSAAARDMQTLDFRVDVMFVSGRLLIGNKDTGPIPVGNATEYQVTAPDNSLITQTLYDFDNDGKPDTSTLGEMVEKTLEDGSTTKVFEAKEDGTLQAVYFSSRKDSDPEQPDVIRQADTKKSFQANGLLTSISKDDFKKTDILIFRESTGQLVLERRGMSDSDMNSRRDADVAKDNAFYYRLMLRGPTDSQLNVGGGITRNGSWEEWSSKYKMTEPFQKRESDHLKSGEWIRVVAINRATGYMATQRTQLQDASQNEGGALNVPLNDMTLMPPNLKVWAERSYEVEDGLTKGEDRHYLVGAEGAALTSDTYIRVYTEWLDEEGRALPEDLGKDNGEQYGLTGRLAKVATENVLTPVSGFSSTGSDLANFPIAPGRNTQVLRLNDNLTTPEHFYIHVSGTQKDENPDFGTGTAEGILATRPEKITPFLAPLYDENKDWKSFSAWNQVKATSTDVIRPLPTYVWAYRPEYQFSQFSLEINDIKLTSLDDEDKEVEQSIRDLDAPGIALEDTLLSIFYSLVSNNNQRLTPIDGPQELILAMGGEEQKIILGEDKTIEFSNIAQIAFLKPEDFLSIRLYSNQDAGNILWQFAFGTGLLVTSSGDEGSRAAQSFLLRSEEDPIKVEWVPNLKIGDKVQWKIEALEGNLATDDLDPKWPLDSEKKVMYGKIKDQHYNSEFSATGTGTGKFEDEWSSQEVTVAEMTRSLYKTFQFKPDMSDEKHPAWGENGKGGTTYKGTKKKDVWRRNPRVGYKISFYLNGQNKASTNIQMDEVDLLRQEYVDLKTVAPDNKKTGFLLPPDRDKISVLSEMPEGEWVDSDYAYSYLLNDTMTTLFNEVSTSFATYRQTSYEGISRIVIQVIDGVETELEEPVTVTIPDDMELELSSSYRHPERNERVGGATRSAHMFGRAIDFKFSPVIDSDENRKKRAKAYYGLWLNAVAGNSPTANMFQLEKGANDEIVRWTDGTITNTLDMEFDENEDGVPDSVEQANHFHLQDNM